MQPIDRDLYLISEFRAIGGGRIQLRYANGQWIEVDLGDLIAKGNRFAFWGDDKFLAQGRIGEGNHYIEWPGEMDIHADSLWWRGVAIESPVGAQH
jgi:hypothetical protein